VYFQKAKLVEEKHLKGKESNGKKRTKSRLKERNVSINFCIIQYR
jgi:hypothetical protein